MLSGTDLRRALEDGEKVGFRLAARVLFIGTFLVIATFAAAANSFLWAIIFAVIAGYFIRAALPEERLRTWLRSYWTGRAGDRWRRRYERLKTRLGRFI